MRDDGRERTERSRARRDRTEDGRGEKREKETYTQFMGLQIGHTRILYMAIC
jgi:hypothetical protein